MSSQTAIVHGHCWFRSITKGGRPALRAYENGQKLGHTMFVAYQSTPKSFWYSSFANKEQLWDYYESMHAKERRLYTIDYSQTDETTTRLYLDLEWIGDEHEDSLQRVELVTDAVSKELNHRGFAGDRSFTTYTFSRQTDIGFKHSYHIHYNGVVFSDNGRPMKQFVASVVDRIKSNPLIFYTLGNKRKSLIDCSIYSKGRHFRLPGSHKCGDDTIPICDQATFMSCVTSGCRQRPNIKQEVSKSVWVPRAVNDDQQLIIRRIEDLLRERGDTTTKVCYDGTTYRGVSHSRKCLIDGSTHTQDCFFAITSTGDIFYHCLGRSGYHEFCSGILLGSLVASDNISWNGDEFTGRCESGQYWKSSLDVLTRDHTDEYVRPYTLEFGRQVLLCIAGMGKGKTYQAKKLIEDMASSRILYVVPRRSLAKAIHGLLDGFQHYADGVDSDKLVIEYESLHRLANGSCKAFDLVVIDEIRSICTAMTTLTTNKYQIQHNCTILRTLATNAAITVCMDADAEVDPAVPHLLQTWWPRPSSIQIERYVCPKLHRNIITTENEDTWIARVKSKLDEGHRVAICCRTKQRANTFAEMFKSRSVTLITGNTSDTVTNNFLLDPDEALEQTQLFVFTSKINIGVDIQREWDYCFIDGYGRNAFCCGARDLVQMCGRFRNLLNDDVLTLVQFCTPTFLDQQKLYDKAKDYYDRRSSHMTEAYSGILRHCAVFEDGFLTLAPDWITELFIYCDYEKLSDFTYELFRVSKLKQYNVYRIPEVAKVSPAVKKTSDDVRDAKKSAEEAVFNEVQGADYEAIIDEAELAMRNHDSTHELTLRRECATILKNFPTAITFDQFKVAKQNWKQLRNLRRHDNMVTQQLVRMEVNQLHKHAWGDHTVSSTISQMKNIDECLQLLHVDNIDDHSTTFTMDMLNTNKDEIIRLCTQSAVAGRRRVRAVQTCPIRVLRRELRAVYGMSINATRVQQNPHVYVYNLTMTDKMKEVRALVDFNYREIGEVLQYTDVVALQERAKKKRKFVLTN